MSQNTIAIVGGGACGALTAFHLVCREIPARVVVIEPRSVLGLGLAYSTTSLRHLLNVPADKISALPDQPEHFLEWLRANYDSNFPSSGFAPRAVFGRYIQSLVASTPEIDHVRTSAVGLRLEGARAVLSLANGAELRADAVVLTTGNFDPAPLPHVSAAAIRNGNYYQSAWKDATYENLQKDAPVTLIGSGLTAIDVLFRLREEGHRGVITAISRHGAFPNRHAPYEPLPECVIAGEPPAKARELLRHVHSSIRAGKPWRAVIDSIRPRTNELWLALPPVEQKRFRRHLQRRWEVVRHRMAPQIADRLEDEMAAGSVVYHRGTVQAVLQSGREAVVLFLNDRGVMEVSGDRVINCTGPDMNYRRVGSPLLNTLFAQGLIVEGPLGGGLWSDRHGALRAQNGTFSSILFNVGPGRMGTLHESIAIPELREQAADLAALLAARFSTDVQPADLEVERNQAQKADRLVFEGVA